MQEEQAQPGPPPPLEIMGTKCIWSPPTLVATIFVIFGWAPWEAKFKGEKKTSEVNG